MADNRPVAISSRPSLPLPMVAQGLRTLQELVAHALVVSFEMIVGNVLSDSKPQLGFAEEYHAVQAL